jgi:hypothetical protein
MILVRHGGLASTEYNAAAYAKVFRHTTEHHLPQGFGSGSGLDPDSIGPVDPDPDSGSRRAKITHKSRKKFVKVHVFKCWMASFES